MLWRLPCSCRLLCFFKIVQILIFFCFANQGYAQRIPDLNPSNIPPGTEIIYLDENGNVIGNKTLILPDNSDLKFDKDTTKSPDARRHEPPRSSESSRQAGQPRDRRPVQQILSEIPLSLLPSNYPPSSVSGRTPTQKPPSSRQALVHPTQSATQAPHSQPLKPSQIKFEEVPEALLPKGFQEIQPTEVPHQRFSKANTPNHPELTFEDVQDSLLPAGSLESTNPTEFTTQRRSFRTRFSRPTQFESVPGALLPKGFRESTKTTETTKPIETTTEKPNETTRKENSRSRFIRPTRLHFEDAPDSLLPKGFARSTNPTENTPRKQAKAAKESNAPSTNSRSTFVRPIRFEKIHGSLLPKGFVESTKADKPTEKPTTLAKSSLSRPPTSRIENIPDSLLPKGFRQPATPTHSPEARSSQTTKNPQSPRSSNIRLEAVPESLLPKGFKPIRSNKAQAEKPQKDVRPVPIKFEQISGSLLPSGYHKLTQPTEATIKTPSRSSDRSRPVKPASIKLEAIPDSLLPKGYTQPTTPTTKRPATLKYEEIPESLLPPGWRLVKPSTETNDSAKGTDHTTTDGSIKRKSQDGSKTSGRTPDRLTKNDGANRESRRFNSHKPSKSNVFLSRRKDGNSRTDSARDSATGNRGRIKSVGVKTTINTSFRVAQRPIGGAKRTGSTKIKEPSISRSADSQGTKKADFDLKDLEIPISVKDFKLNLSSPINITTGNYTITFFGKPPQPKDGKPEPIRSVSTIKNTNNSTKPATALMNTTAVTSPPRHGFANQTLTTRSGGKTSGGRLRWPLNRRRKISTARRFLLRTRKPLPTRRTPRPLRPTKSTRQNKWSPRSRPPPRFTTRLSIFKKFQTIPTQPTTTPSTTTEHVYTRKPSSDDSLTSDYIKSSGVIKLEDGVEWTNSLADKNSKEFKTLALDLKVLLQEVFKNSVWAPVFIRVDIDGFYKGSVVADFDAIFKRAIANRIKAIHLRKILIDTLNRDGGQLGTYTVNKTSVIFDTFTDLIDPGVTTPAPKEEPVLPQWAIAVIVVSLASLLFVILFSCVAWCNKSFAKKRQNDRFLDDGGETEKPPLGGYDNLAIESFYDLEEWKRPVKQPKYPGRAQNNKKRKDRYYDSWKTEWSGFKRPTRPAMSEF